MEKNTLNHYKSLLLKEKEEIIHTLNNTVNNGHRENLQDKIGELSMYDNHPADVGTETFQMEMEYALKAHENDQLKDVEEALKRIDRNHYGMCEMCGANILQERLEFLPSTKLCSKCADKRIVDNRTIGDRPVEEKVLFPPFGRSNLDEEDTVGYDGEDTWQEVQNYSTSSKADYINDTNMAVEKIEEISNEEYKKQLPD